MMLGKCRVLNSRRSVKRQGCIMRWGAKEKKMKKKGMVSRRCCCCC